MFCLIALFDLKTRAGIQSCLHLVVLQFAKSRDMTSRLKWVYKGKVTAQVLQLAAIDESLGMPIKYVTINRMFRSITIF